MSVYGKCPICGADGVSRERSPDGNTCCAKGHSYKHHLAVYDKEIKKPEDMLSEIQKINKKAYITNYYDYGEPCSEWIGFPDSDIQVMCQWDGLRENEWGVGFDAVIYNSSKNPQDILDILKAHYNCGKLEEEKK